MIVTYLVGKVVATKGAAAEMARQTEPSVNNAMERVLQGMLSRSHVRSESTQTITGQAGKRPDIIIEDLGRAPVVIEAEFFPGATVEAEAKSRLGLEVAASGREIEAAIALRYPYEIGDADDHVPPLDIAIT